MVKYPAATRTQSAIVLLTLLLTALLLAACGGQGANTADVLNRGVGPEPESLDPHRSRSSQAHSVQRDLFEGLVGYSPAGDLRPAAAERWTISDDGRRYTFALRPKARWSNGEAVTAADFVASFRRLVDPATASFYAESLVAIVNAADIIAGRKPADTLGVAATGPHELAITLAQPVPYFLSLLAQPSTYPVHSASIVKYGESFSRPGRLVSNGPYRLVSWAFGSVIELGRNEYYWDNEHTAIERVRYHVTVEPGAELYRYRAGELDVTATIPSEAYAQLRAERPQDLRVAPFLGMYFYALNLSRPPFKNNPALRKALSMAIDREVLTAKVIGRGEAAAYGAVPPGVYNYTAQRLPYADMPKSERVAAARRLYQEAGYSAEHPAQVEVRYNTSQTHEKVALAIRSMWRDVLGFDAELINEEFRVLVANMRAKEVTEVFRLSWLGDYNDPYTFLSIFESDNPSNMFGYKSAEYDALLQQADMETDPGLRRQLLEHAERVVLDDMPVIPVYVQVSKHLVSPRVVGWQDNVLDFHYSQHLSLRQPKP